MNAALKIIITLSVVKNGMCLMSFPFVIMLKLQHIQANGMDYLLVVLFMRFASFVCICFGILLARSLMHTTPMHQLATTYISKEKRNMCMCASVCENNEECTHLQSMIHCQETWM